MGQWFLLALAGTLWAVHDWLRRDAIHPRLLTFTMAMSGVIGLQALFGILLAVTGNRPADGATHFRGGTVDPVRAAGGTEPRCRQIAPSRVGDLRSGLVRATAPDAARGGQWRRHRRVT